MVVNSRTKGKVAENAVVQTLKHHFDQHFERRPLGIPGPDIKCPDHWIYAIEVKNNPKIKAIHLLGKPCQFLSDCWKQADAQADALDKFPLLVVKVEAMWFASEDGVSWQKFDNWCAVNVHAKWNTSQAVPQ